MQTGHFLLCITLLFSFSITYIEPALKQNYNSKRIGLARYECQLIVIEHVKNSVVKRAYKGGLRYFRQCLKSPERIDAMFCTKCGSQIEDGKKFCTKCGAAIHSAQPEETQPEIAPKKRSKKGLAVGIIAGIVIIAAGVAAAWIFVVQPQMQYDKAVELASQGEHAEAVEIFAHLGDYKDAEARLESSQKLLDYKAATTLFNDGDYEKALSAYQALGSYKDSKAMAEDCQTRLDYAAAVVLFEEGEYEAAKALFEQTADYEESRKYVSICGYKMIYAEALELLGKRDYEKALQYLTVIEKGAERNAIEISTMLDYTEFSTAKKTCTMQVSYQKGKDYFKRGLFYSAFVELSKASGLKEADQLAEACAQPFETGEVYRNDAYSDQEVRVTFSVPDAKSKNVCVKIYAGHNDVVAICQIKAGEKITIRLPSGVYSFNKAEGYIWYGAEEYFGEDGVYSELVFGEEMRLSAQLNTATLLVPIFSYTITFNQTEGNVAGNSLSRGNF